MWEKPLVLNSPQWAEMENTKTLWLRRPLLNAREIYEWALETGISKMMPAEELHLTLATCREPVDWSGLVLEEDTLEISEGPKPIQIFGFMSKAIAFSHERVSQRHETLAQQFPTMDHAQRTRPHVTLMRGGKMPRETYNGKLVFGPEIASEFNPVSIREIKHVKVKNYIHKLVD